VMLLLVLLPVITRMLGNQGECNPRSGQAWQR